MKGVGLARPLLLWKTLNCVDQLPNARKMMVVVLGDEIQMIYQPHRCLQTRMRNGTRKDRRIQFLHALEQSFSGSAKLAQQLLQPMLVVMRFFGFPIPQVRHGELVTGRHEVVHSRQPQRLKVEQMAGVFLSGPFS